MTATFLGDFARYLQDVAKVPTASSIRSYCMDVANLCASLHFPRPIFPPLLQRALDRETAAHPVSRAKHPATPAFVAAFVHDGSIPRVLRVAAALLWFSTLRGSEILATSPTTVKPFSLRRQDVSFAPDSSYLRLSFRKGKPFAKNEPSVRIIVRQTGANRTPLTQSTWSWRIFVIPRRSTMVNPCYGTQTVHSPRRSIYLTPSRRRHARWASTTPTMVCTPSAPGGSLPCAPIMSQMLTLGLKAAGFLRRATPRTVEPTCSKPGGRSRPLLSRGRIV